MIEGARGRGRLTGRKVLAIALGSFGLILGANLTMAWFAVNTFSGLTVDNGYVASQSFDARRSAQEALGWTLALDHGDGRLSLALTDASGNTVRPLSLAAMVGRPTSSRTDRVLDLQSVPGGYAAMLDLEPGAWMVVVDATAADGTAYRRREDLIVPDFP